MDRMVEDAQRVGANAIVGVRFSTSEVMASAAEILVYGTAVLVEPLANRKDESQQSNT